VKPIGVLQVCDSLAAGGMERVAVNLANALPPDRYRSHLCATRAEGPLVEFVAPHVNKICLHRAGRFDVAAMRRLIGYIRENEIQLLHAHGTALFMSALVARFKPCPVLVWHDHFGRYATEERPAWLYRLATGRVAGVITVNQSLAAWARGRLQVPAERVRYIPNFVFEPSATVTPAELPGKNGCRIVCVANFRPQKDHLNLLAAMRAVLKLMPDAHLLLIGFGVESDCFRQVNDQISRNGLHGHVTVLGPRTDVNAVLRGCDVGVLSSASEGLPLALLEYGMAGLAVVVTKVGQCDEVLDSGRCGLVVPPRSPEELGKAIVVLLRSPQKRQELGNSFMARVHQAYSQDAVIRQVTEVYERSLACPRKQTQ
jgi:glycosyltransferase involved in cell wall biosynthesis